MDTLIPSAADLAGVQLLRTLDDAAALVAVNALGRATIGDGPHFWAAPFEQGDEFGCLGLPFPLPADAVLPRKRAQHGKGGAVSLDRRRSAHRLA